MQIAQAVNGFQEKARTLYVRACSFLTQSELVVEDAETAIDKGRAMRVKEASSVLRDVAKKYTKQAAEARSILQVCNKHDAAWKGRL